MTERYTCGFCGATHDNADDYFKCVSSCRDILKKQIEEEKQQKYLEELNADINRVKQAEKYYKEKLEEFKLKYPKEYELNFSPTCSSDCTCHKEKTETYVNEDNLPNWTTQSNSLEFSYENNGKDEPKMSAKVNGKEVDDDIIRRLLIHPDVNDLARILRIF